jgi:concanavalin A-like lectin/glucanase superfamily protein
MYLGGNQGTDLKLRPRGGAVVVPPSSLLTSIVSYWKMEEASGTRIDSVVASGNDLTDNNTVGSTTGIIGNGAAFVSANNEYLTRAGTPFDFTASWTIALWANLTNTADYRSLLATTPSNSTLGPLRAFIAPADTKLEFDFQPGLGGSALLVSISTGVWTNIVIWHDNSNDEVGVAFNAGTPTTGTVNMTAAMNGLAIGAISTGGGIAWEGAIDEVGFWSTTLSSAQRTSLYNGGAGITYPFTGVP